jgi:hypothetical protein
VLPLLLLLLPGITLYSSVISFPTVPIYYLSSKRACRDYKKKTPEDPPSTKLAFDGRFLDADSALRVVLHHHSHWCLLVQSAASKARAGGDTEAAARLAGYAAVCASEAPELHALLSKGTSGGGGGLEAPAASAAAVFDLAAEEAAARTSMPEEVWV